MKIEWVSTVKGNISGNSLGYGLANQRLKEAFAKVADLDDDADVALHFCHPQHYKPNFKKFNVLYCLAPGTKILNADLTWSNVEDLDIGDELVGFDEKLGSGNKFRSSTVQATERVRGPSVRITTDRGDITCSVNHRFVAKRGFDTQGRNGSSREWIRADRLVAGDFISYSWDPWKVVRDYDHGYLAALFDGEGYYSESSNQFGFAQRDNECLAKARDILDRLGFEYRVDLNSKSDVYTVRILNSLPAMGRIRPYRLMPKSRGMWEGRRSWGPRSTPARVLSVEFIGDQDLIATQTSTGTLISDGFLSHNTMCEHEWLSDDFYKAFTQCDIVITPSEYCKKIFIDEGIGVPVYVSPLGVDTSLFKLKKRKWNKKKPFRILYLGAPNIRKYSILEDLYKDVVMGVPGLELYIKTTGADLQGADNGTGIVQNGNWILDNRKLPEKELVKIFHSAHCKVFPHLGEGFGLTALEALSTGLPLIVSDYASTKEFCNNENSYPILCNPGTVDAMIEERHGDKVVPGKLVKVDTMIPDSAALYEALFGILQNYGEAIGKGIRGRHTAMNLTWDHAAKKLLETLELVDSPIGSTYSSREASEASSR